MVLDVGANVGQFGQELRLIGYEGLILSFEPDPASFRALQKVAAADGRWEALNLALGSAPGEAPFNIMARSDFNSFRAPSTASTTTFVELNQVVETIAVKVETLGALFPNLQAKHRFKRPYLKMDTQGFDLEVFTGARDILPQLVGLQSELSIKPIYTGSPDWRSVLAVFEAQKFELAALYPVDAWAQELVEFNCFLTRKTAAE